MCLTSVTGSVNHSLEGGPGQPHFQGGGRVEKYSTIMARATNPGAGDGSRVVPDWLLAFIPSQKS
jgi:hypothetical protein